MYIYICIYVYVYNILYYMGVCVCIDISQDFELYNNNTNIYIYVYIIQMCIYIVHMLHCMKSQCIILDTKRALGRCAHRLVAGQVGFLEKIVWMTTQRICLELPSQSHKISFATYVPPTQCHVICSSHIYKCSRVHVFICMYTLNG